MRKDKHNNQKRHEWYSVIMEYAWLTIAITSIITAGIDLYYHSWNTESLKFCILAALSFAMFLFRRYRRKQETNTNS